MAENLKKLRELGKRLPNFEIKKLIVTTDSEKNATRSIQRRAKDKGIEIIDIHMLATLIETKKPLL